MRKEGLRGWERGAPGHWATGEVTVGGDGRRGAQGQGAEGPGAWSGERRGGARDSRGMGAARSSGGRAAGLRGRSREERVGFGVRGWGLCFVLPKTQRRKASGMTSLSPLLGGFFGLPGYKLLYLYLWVYRFLFNSIHYNPLL